MSCAAPLPDRTTARRFRPGRSLAIAAVLALSMMPGVGGGAACVSRPGSPGRWTLQSHDGVSWLVSPCGERFFSIGINCLTDSASSQMTSDLEKNSSQPANRLRTAAQILRVGLQYRGRFSPPDAPLPSVPELDLGWRARFYWDDPFDPAVEERMLTKAREAVAPYEATGYRIGYSPDNEVGWWNEKLFTSYLKRSGTNHTKQALVDLVRRHYGGDWPRFTGDFAVCRRNFLFPGTAAKL